MEVVAKSSEVHVKFCGWVESKVRILHKSLEGSVRGMQIHPNPELYDLRQSDAEWPLGCHSAGFWKVSKELAAFFRGFLAETP